MNEPIVVSIVNRTFTAEPLGERSYADLVAQSELPNSGCCMIALVNNRAEVIKYRETTRRMWRETKW